MALVKEWKSELSTKTVDDLAKLAHAFRILADWDMFAREFVGVKEIRDIVVGELLKA